MEKEKQLILSKGQWTDVCFTREGGFSTTSLPISCCTVHVSLDDWLLRELIDGREYVELVLLGVEENAKTVYKGKFLFDPNFGDCRFISSGRIETINEPLEEKVARLEKEIKLITKS